MDTDRRKVSFWRGIMSAGLALGLAFASGFVILNGRQAYTVTMQKQKNMDKEKSGYTILDTAAPAQEPDKLSI